MFDLLLVLFVIFPTVFIASLLALKPITRSTYSKASQYIIFLLLSYAAGFVALFTTWFVLVFYGFSYLPTVFLKVETLGFILGTILYISATVVVILKLHTYFQNNTIATEVGTPPSDNTPARAINQSNRGILISLLFGFVLGLIYYFFVIRSGGGGLPLSWTFVVFILIAYISTDKNTPRERAKEAILPTIVGFIMFYLTSLVLARIIIENLLTLFH